MVFISVEKTGVWPIFVGAPARHQATLRIMNKNGHVL